MKTQSIAQAQRKLIGNMEESIKNLRELVRLQKELINEMNDVVKNASSIDEAKTKLGLNR